MKIDLGTVEISKEDWDLIMEHFSKDEARDYMREVAVADIRNEAIGRDSVEDEK